ncbi:MAG: hypothetical protein AAFV80_12630, partial [Bacteroidota bacterium]
KSYFVCLICCYSFSNVSVFAQTPILPVDGIRFFVGFEAGKSHINGKFQYDTDQTFFRERDPLSHGGSFNLGLLVGAQFKNNHVIELEWQNLNIRTGYLLLDPDRSLQEVFRQTSIGSVFALNYQYQYTFLRLFAVGVGPTLGIGINDRSPRERVGGVESVGVDPSGNIQSTFEATYVETSLNSTFFIAGVKGQLMLKINPRFSILGNVTTWSSFVDVRQLDAEYRVNGADLESLNSTSGVFNVDLNLGVRWYF